MGWKERKAECQVSRGNRGKKKKKISFATGDGRLFFLLKSAIFFALLPAWKGVLTRSANMQVCLT